MRYLIAGMLTFISTIAFCQEIESFGVFGGLNFPFTVDQGLRTDPRFVGRYTLRGTPIGLSYGHDKVGYGFLISPAYLQIGQNFTIVNYLRGHVRSRDIRMNY